MRKRIVASVIIIAVISIIIFSAVFLGGNIQSTDFAKIGLANLNFSNTKVFNQEAIRESKPPELSIKDIRTGIVDDGKGNFSIIFNIFNPNKGTVIVESISYNVYSNSTRIASGDIGQRPEGFVDAQDSIFPVIGNGTLILKDKKIIESANNQNVSQIGRNNDTSKFLVNGSYFFKQMGSFQSTGGEKEFSIIYPRP
jgi:LEA14-like dessication related protein